MPIPDTCIDCGKQLTSEEIEAFGNECAKCHKEALDARPLGPEVK